MKRAMLGLMLFVVAGSASAQSPNLVNNFRSAVTTFLVGSPAFPGGVSAGTVAFFAGDITHGFENNRNGFSGFAVLATQDTPLAALGTSAEKFFNTGYEALLPLYLAMDGPAMRLLEPLKPIAQPVGRLVEIGAGIFVLRLNGGASAASAEQSMGSGMPALPGLE